MCIWNTIVYLRLHTQAHRNTDTHIEHLTNLDWQEESGVSTKWAQGVPFWGHVHTHTHTEEWKYKKASIVYKKQSKSLWNVFLWTHLTVSVLRSIRMSLTGLNCACIHLNSVRFIWRCLTCEAAHTYFHFTYSTLFNHLISHCWYSAKSFVICR